MDARGRVAGIERAPRRSRFSEVKSPERRQLDVGISRREEDQRRVVRDVGEQLISAFIQRRPRPGPVHGRIDAPPLARRRPPGLHGLVGNGELRKPVLSGRQPPFRRQGGRVGLSGGGRELAVPVQAVVLQVGGDPGRVGDELEHVLQVRAQEDLDAVVADQLPDVPVLHARRQRP